MHSFSYRSIHPNRPTHLPHILLSLPKRQRLRLGKEIAQKNPMMIRTELSEGIMARSRRDKVRRDELGALVHELVERVLAIRSRGPPQNRSRLIVDAVPVLGDEFPVGLHVALLEVVGEFMEVLVVGEECVGLGA